MLWVSPAWENSLKTGKGQRSEVLPGDALTAKKAKFLLGKGKVGKRGFIRPGGGGCEVAARCGVNLCRFGSACGQTAKGPAGVWALEMAEGGRSRGGAGRKLKSAGVLGDLCTDLQTIG